MILCIDVLDSQFHIDLTLGEIKSLSEVSMFGVRQTSSPSFYFLKWEGAGAFITISSRTSS